MHSAKIGIEAEAETAQLSAIEEIIKNAEYVKEDANAIHDKFNAFYYYSVNVEFNGETDELWLNVGKNKFDGTNHIYAITYNNDNGTASPLKSLSRPEGIAIPNSPVNDIIPEKGENVKGVEENTENDSETRYYIFMKLSIDIKENADGNYFYFFAIEKGTAPQTLLAVVTNNAATAPINSIPQNTNLSTGNSKNSLKTTDAEF